MSGVEALAVISIVANITALTEFSCDVVSRIREFGENAHEVPKAFRDIQTVLPLISSTIARTRDQIESKILNEDTCKALRPVLEGCKDKLRQLKVILSDSMAQEGASTLKRGWMAIKSMRKDKEVKEIAQALDRFVAHLVHHHVSEGATTKEIDSLKFAMSSISMNRPEKPLLKAQTHFLVPLQWSDDFAGRGEVMVYLDSKLCLEGRHSRVALVGLGGMGKTRIALEYAKKFKRSKQISVFWVYAGTVQRFKNAYHEIARKLKIPGYQGPDSDVLTVVRDYLQGDRSGRWLMIVDNADDAETMYGSASLRLADYLPKSDQGSILLTTRFQKVGASFTSVRNVMNLQKMTLEESEALLRARLGDECQGDHQNLYQELATELERTPLALVQAASFVSQNCIPLDSYLRMYRESDTSKIRLLGENFEDDVRDSEAKNPIATTWIISFDYIRMHVPQAAELLSLMSVLDAQNIPEILLPHGKDAISFNKAIGTLEAFSFISTRTATPSSLQQFRLFDLHRLVRLAIRNWLDMNSTLDQQTAQMQKILVSWCSKTESSQKFELSHLLLPHATEILASDLLHFRSQSDQSFEVEDIGKPSLLDLHSVSTMTLTPFAETIYLLETVDSIDNLVRDTGRLLGYVTWMMADHGNHVEARNYGSKSVDFSTRALGQSDIMTLIAIRTLAVILENLGDFEHAERLIRQAVTIYEVHYGLQHVLTLRRLKALALFLVKRQREQEAKEIYELTIQRWQESHLLHRRKHRLEYLTMLAELHLLGGDLEQSERCALVALRGYEAAHDDLQMIGVLNHLSTLYWRQDQLGLIVEIQKANLHLCLRSYERNHPVTMETRRNLSHSLLKHEKVEEPTRQASIALELVSQIYGPSSDNYTRYYRQFHDSFAAQGQTLSLQGQIDTIQPATSVSETNATIKKLLASIPP